MPTVRRMRWRAGYAHSPDKVTALRNALLAAGCTGAVESGSVTLTFEQGSVTAFMRRGEVTIYCEMEGVGVTAVKRAIEDQLGLMNPVVVEDEALL